MNTNEICNAVINGNFSNDEINQIINAVKAAQKFTRARRSASAILTLKVGQRGRLSGLRPNKLNGTEVTIVSVNRSRVLVREDGKPAWSSYTVPAQCVEAIS